MTSTGKYMAERALDFEALVRAKADVRSAASRAIDARMTLGAQKYDPDDWRGETLQRHIRRAIKHALTALEIRDGDRVDDGDEHLAAAVCRLSMALQISEASR